MATWNTTGCNVDITKQASSSILFALAGSTTIRQWEVTAVTEIRGLSSTAAKNKVPSSASGVGSNDSTTQTIYWAHLGGKTYSITTTTGSKNEYSSARKDESGQWVTTKTVRTYFVTGLDTNVWGTTELDSDGAQVTLTSSGTEVTISIEKSTSFVRDLNGDNLYSSVVTTVKEKRRINTQQNANSIVTSNTAAVPQCRVHTPFTYPDPTHAGSTVNAAVVLYAMLPNGTEKFASARYVSPSEGWTVTITQKVYSFSSTNNDWVLG